MLTVEVLCCSLSVVMEPFFTVVAVTESVVEVFSNVVIRSFIVVVSVERELSVP